MPLDSPAAVEGARQALPETNRETAAPEIPGSRPGPQPAPAGGNVETRPEPDRPGDPNWLLKRIWLHAVLFLATVATTIWAVSPVYAVSLLSILAAHEFGHFFAARRYGVAATLPYFIPMPMLFGTMGAVIRMSPFIPNRKVLFDIAAAGPLAGLVLAVPLSALGVALSDHVPADPEGPGILLGDPLLFQVFERLLHGPAPENTVLMLHDVGFAGWVGLFVTALNLLPIGQLDGGHVSYAAFGPRSYLVARLTFVGLLIVCATVATNYIGIAVLLFFLGLKHGPTLDDTAPLGAGRKKLALVLLAVFIACFTPNPISFRAGTGSEDAEASRSGDGQDGLACNLAVGEIADALRSFLEGVAGADLRANRARGLEIHEFGVERRHVAGMLVAMAAPEDADERHVLE